MLLSWTEEMFLWQGWWLFSKFDVTNFWKCLMRMTLTPTELKTERWGGQSRNWSSGTQWVDESKWLSFHLEGAWRRQQAVDHRAPFFSFQSLPLLLTSSQHVLFHLCERQVWQPKPGWTLNRFHQGNVHCWLLPFTWAQRRQQAADQWPQGLPSETSMVCLHCCFRESWCSNLLPTQLLQSVPTSHHSSLPIIHLRTSPDLAASTWMPHPPHNPSHHSAYSLLLSCSNVHSW